ncbi:MAG TPA: hypothetical protein VEG08_02090 [Terriglobales bacterium]|nr:hypothetical protein [Terriglobales bacterium]
MVRLTRISFGGTAGVVTSMALITGLHAAGAKTGTIVSALLIAAVADNLTDSLSVHMYQESERLGQRAVFLGTLANFATRFCVCLSFVLITALFRPAVTAVVGIAWGMALLTALTFFLARSRGIGTLPEVAKHLTVALVILLVSQGIGQWITSHVDLLLMTWKAPGT